MPSTAYGSEWHGLHGLQGFLLQRIITVSKMLSFFQDGPGKYFSGIINQKSFLALPLAGSHNIFNEVVKIQQHLESANGLPAFIVQLGYQ